MEFGELEAEVKLPEIEEPQKEPVPEKRAVQEKKLEIPKKYYELPKKYYIYAAIALVCLLLTMYPLIVQSYTVETRLVFIIGNRNALNKDNWSPMREMSLYFRILQHPLYLPNDIITGLILSVCSTKRPKILRILSFRT